MKKPLLLPAVALLLAAAASARAADPEWFTSAVKDWDGGIQRAEHWEWVRFYDEEDIERTLYCRTQPIKFGVDRYIRDNCQLYSFPAPTQTTREVRRMQVTWYSPAASARVAEEINVDLLIVTGAEVSPYYVEKADGGGGTISRRDRPETRLPITWSAASYISQSGHFPWPPTEWSQPADASKQRSEKDKILGSSSNIWKDGDTVHPWNRVKVAAPAAIGSASSSPLTSRAPNGRTCAGLPELWKKPGAGAGAQLLRYLPPQYLELQSADLLEVYKVKSYDAAEKGLGRGDESGIPAFQRDARDAGEAVVNSLGTIATMSPASERFTPAESRLLVCRAQQLGRETAFKDALAKLGDDRAKAKAFVSLWRQYLARDLAEVRAGANDAGRMPDHEAINAAVLARFEDALAGKVAGVNAAAKAAPADAKAPVKKAKRAPKVVLPEAGEVFK